MKVGDKVKIIGSHTIDGKHRIGLIGEILDIDWRDEACFVLYPKGQAWVKRTDLEVIESINSPHPEATISGWIVRDKQNITSILAHCGSKLYLFQEKPKRIDSMGIWDKEGEYCRIPDNLFPNVAFESDPFEVEITIKPKKQ